MNRIDELLPTLNALIEQADQVERHFPYPRVGVDRQQWQRAGEHLAWGHWSLLGLWGDEDTVHMAVRDHADSGMAVLSLACPEDRFPSIGRVHPPAILLERGLRDLFHLEPEQSPDPRPWLDHGRWQVASPLAAGKPRVSGADNYSFLPVEGEHLHQIPVGPVHAGIIEPGHFRFTAAGETIVRLEARLGYTHKGIESLLAGADLARGTQLAGRCSGDSTVAYQYAFACAAEQALQIQPPTRAIWLRALLAELERLANHIGDIGGICNDAAFAPLHAHCLALREQILRAMDECFGHRFARDLITPGGLAHDPEDSSLAGLTGLTEQLECQFRELVDVYDNTASLQDRTVGAGIVHPEWVQRFATGGYVGRASGRNFDARRLSLAPYDELDFEVPVFEQGDVNARVWVRIREVFQSLQMVRQIIERLPAGAVQVELPAGPGEGMALIEGFRGDILVWLALAENGRIRRCHLRDPSWFQWPLLEAAIEGNIVADFPLCNKSFNCSYSGCDL